MNYLKQGNIVGTMYSMSSEFIQTVGKGTVDETCQLISSGLDSAVKTVIFGLVDVSTINALMEDNWGISPGTLFNGAAGAISDCVDFVLYNGYSDISTEALLDKIVELTKETDS